MAVCPKLNQTIQTCWCAKLRLEGKTFQKPWFFTLEHSYQDIFSIYMEWNWILGIQSGKMEVLLPFPQDQIMFVLFWQQLSTTELCYGPIMLQTTDPATKGYSFLSASFCTACLQNCGTRKALKPPIPKDNHREDNFTARNGLQVVGEDNRHLWKEQGKVWGQANHFWHSCLPLPPCPTHPLQSTQVSSALWIPLLQSVVVSHFTLF